MTFSCKNFDFNLDNCRKLKTDCIPGRPGCVLEGKVKFSEEIHNRLDELKEATNIRQRKRMEKKARAKKRGNYES